MILVAFASGGGLGCDNGGGSPASPEDAGTEVSGVVDGPPAVLANTIVEAPGAGSGTYGDPQRAVNGVRGGGDRAGGTDVFSLGYTAGGDDVLVLRWAGQIVQDGPGADVVVFENPFQIGSSGAVFLDPGIVSVSRDGMSWVDFPHRYQAAEPAAYSADPAAWAGFAGVTPVRWNVDSNDVYPFNPADAGGDGFDLQDLLPDGGTADAIRREGFRFLRVRSAATQVNPETGAPYPHDPTATGPDIDGVVARYLVPDT